MRGQQQTQTHTSKKHRGVQTASPQNTPILFVANCCWKPLSLPQTCSTTFRKRVPATSKPHPSHVRTISESHPSHIPTTSVPHLQFWRKFREKHSLAHCEVMSNLIQNKSASVLVTVTVIHSEKIGKGNYPLFRISNYSEFRHRSGNPEIDWH